VLPAEKQRCAEAGMDDFLSKPLELTILSKVLSIVYNKKIHSSSSSSSNL